MHFISRSRLTIILNITSFLLCIVFLLVIVNWVNTQEEERLAADQALYQEAKPYRDEVSLLREQLSALRKGYTYTSHTAELMLSFVLSDVSDLTYIEQLSSIHSFPPIVAIDCTQPLDTIDEYIKAVSSNWEIMLFAPELNPQAYKSITTVKAHLDSAGKKDTGILLLRSRSVNPATVQEIKDCGFIGYTLYHDTPVAGQNEDDTVFFEYSSFKADGFSTSSIDAFTERLNALCHEKASMVCILDMDILHTLEDSSRTADYLLQQFDQYVSNGKCNYSTVSNVVDKLSQINESLREYAEYASKEVARIQTRIDELEDIIRKIYADD